MEMASPFDPPADGAPLSAAQLKMRHQIESTLRAQMAKSVSRSGEIDAASVIDRIEAALSGFQSPSAGAASIFCEMVVSTPSQIDADLANLARQELGGDAELVTAAARSALNAAKECGA